MEDGQNLIKGRLVSIDALRGFDMLWLMGGVEVVRALDKVFDNGFTNAIAGQTHHAEWIGFGFYDLIFPLFLFIVGLVLPLSVTRRIEQGGDRKVLYIHIVKRTALLILLGFMYNGLLRFNWGAMRWSGVLQRIGVCYFFAAIMVMNTKWRTQAIVTGAILVLYWAVLTLIPVPDYGAGVITKEGCLNSFIDQLLLPGRFARYRNLLDSEGILSTVPAIATTLMGVLAGHWLRSKQPGNRKAAMLAGAGLISLVIGYCWGLVFPVIKIIWSSSYVMVAGGYSLLLLALFYWLIDVKGYKKWAFFFIVIGMNPITIYFSQKFVNFEGIAEFFVNGIAMHSGVFDVLVLAAAALVVRWLFLLFLHRRKIFLKL